MLSMRNDIIVITDEAHRSQYDILAANMRRALPNAAFIGFTGTPLIAGEEERTREVFGDYVSVYDFAQSSPTARRCRSIYESRMPELQLTNEHLGDEIARVRRHRARRGRGRRGCNGGSPPIPSHHQ